MKCFQTWNRPEYQEWAIPIAEGYLLVIIRKEKNKFLCVKAKLLMGETGLPGFEVLEEKYISDKRDAEKQISLWKKLQ